ncbi:unnamed protein product [Trichogramma brassicae]|uniref:Uncharacterized protein n=1 Tax=Trichogramma brassicae TaxID=86971 RepID=A0A6H5IBX3_9HYME|nr:unnamed protein product [Trichogramma brassicae]
MQSRLDKLFILLDTGANIITKQAAAEQLGEVQRLHPHELHHLLAKVSRLLKSAQWDTRIAAGNAIHSILSQVPQWNPTPASNQGLWSCSFTLSRYLNYYCGCSYSSRPSGTAAATRLSRTHILDSLLERSRIQRALADWVVSPCALLVLVYTHTSYYT